MQKFRDAVASLTGTPVGGASVQVNVQSTGLPATIYSDNGITVAANPLKTDAVTGAFSFYAADGRYQLVISGANITTQTINDILLVDAIPSDQAIASSVNAADILSIQQGGTLKQATGSLLASMVLGADSPIPVVNGGTGATTAVNARSNLGAAASGANSDITSLTGLTTPLALSEGGTGASTAANARSNLGLGSMATQNASSVAITGGTISGVTLSDLASTAVPGGAGLVGFDGTTLANFFLSKNNRVVDSIAALRGLSKTTYTRAFVTGYYAAGDGGGGAYWYDPTDTTSGAYFTGSIAPITAPAAPTLGSAAGGTLAATTYYVKVTYVTAAGETLPSAESSLAVAVNNVLTVTSPAAQAGATGYNVYVSTATGTETKQNGTPIAIGTNWTEPTGGLIAGAALPSIGTAGSLLTVSAVTNGTLAVNQQVNGAGSVAMCYIAGQVSGTGGAGTYTLTGSQAVSSQTLVADNGGTYLVAYDGGRWKLFFQGNSVSVRQFGARGTGADDSFAFQNAYNALIGKGGRIFVQQGNYFLANPIILDTRHESIQLYGEARGKGASTINAVILTAQTAAFKTATTGGYVPGLGTGQQPLYGITLDNLAIQGRDTTHDHLVQLDALYSCAFNSLYMVGTAAGKDCFQLTNFADATFNDYRVNGAGKHGLNIGDARATNASTTLRINGGYMRSVHGVGIYGIGAGQASNYIINGMICEVGGRDPVTYTPVAADIGVGMAFENVTGLTIDAYCEGSKNADIILGGIIDNNGTVTKKGACNAVELWGYYYGSAGSGTGANCVDGLLLVNANQVKINGHWANHSRAEQTIRATAITDVANVSWEGVTYGAVPSGYVNDNWNRVSPSDIPSKWLLGGSLKAQPTTTTAAGVFAAELSGDGLRLPGNTSTTNLKTGNGYRYFDSTYSLTGTYITDGFYYDPSPRYISYAGNPPATLPAGYGEYYANPTGAVTSALPTGVVTGQKIKVSNFSSTGGNTITLTGTAYANVVVNPGKTAILTWSATSGNWSSTV